MLKSIYSRALPLEANEFLCELMYFYIIRKISYFGNILYIAPCQPGGPRLYQGAAPLLPPPHAGYSPEIHNKMVIIIVYYVNQHTVLSWLTALHYGISQCTIP